MISIALLRSSDIAEVGAANMCGHIVLSPGKRLLD